MKTCETPSVFWHSDPVNPDETLMISGGGFAADAVVELAVADGKPLKWVQVKPLQASESCLKAVIPAKWEPGVYACRVKQGEKSSKTFLVNGCDAWWKQGDEGLDKARAGGWLRLLGKCLDFGGKASVELLSDDGAKTSLELEERSCFSLKAKLPAKLKAGVYEVEVSNGKGPAASAGKLEILPAKKAAKAVINVVEQGADPTGMKDCTLALVGSMERLSALGGGTLFFPRGRYRIDSNLRTGTWIDCPLMVPENVTLKGEGNELSSLWWPDREKALPTLIDGRSDFAIEDLAIYTQGQYSTIVTGESDVRIKNVLIRASYSYLAGPAPSGQRGKVAKPPVSPGAGILLCGENNQVVGCDVYTEGMIAISVRNGRGSLVADNKLRGISGAALYAREMIFERNEILDGSNFIALFMGASVCKHVYYAFNKTKQATHEGDHEGLTFDGHGCSCLGKISKCSGAFMTLAEEPKKRCERDHLQDMFDATAYIVDGRGAGQLRQVKDRRGLELELESPWDVEPDGSSLLLVGAFNGRHLIIGNVFDETGPLQLYPPNVECIVAGNKLSRTGHIYNLARLRLSDDGVVPPIEPSWRNQFLGNHVLIGNGWGGGKNRVDSWQGGEMSLELWSICVKKPLSTNANVHMKPEDLQELLNEPEPRERCLAVSRCHVVRGHLVDSNSSICVRGVASDVIVEGCLLKKSERGIRVEMDVDFKRSYASGQLQDLDPAPSAELPPLPFLRPDGVLLRNNKFEDVKTPLSGTALDEATVLPPSKS